MFLYLLFILPALLLGVIAQGLVTTRYAAAKARPAPMSGAMAARQILDHAGLQGVRIEQVPGQLSDHYDPRSKVIRLSPEVYDGRTLAAVGIAAHESGHAIQHARGYAPLALRQMAYPIASFGSNAAIWILILGAVMHIMPIIIFAVGLFGFVALFQIINLPVEYNASNRAKQHLVELGIVNVSDMRYVRKVLGAAALTYVAAMLSALLTFLYYAMRFLASRD